MEVIFIAAGIGILLFLCLYIGFRTGLRLGMQAAKGQPPAKLDPVGAIRRAKISRAERNELMKAHENMMAYDGWLPDEKARAEGVKHG